MQNIALGFASKDGVQESFRHEPPQKSREAAQECSSERKPVVKSPNERALKGRKKRPEPG